MIEHLSESYPIRELCAVLEVSRSGFYAWQSGQQSARELANLVMAQDIRKVFESKRGRYGSPRITAQLRREGRVCNHKRVERIMRQQGLRGRSGRKRRVRTTNSDHDQPVAPNLLKGRAALAKVDEVWVADITYVRTAEGWLFVAAVMDLYSRRILGWSIWDNLGTQGPLQALARAVAKRGYRPDGVIHHSDRGIQYASGEYRRELQRHGLIASMSRKGNCYDNGAMEAFWSTLKREGLEESQGWTKDRTRREIFEFIEAYYNRSRLHSSLGYQSPVDFEHQSI